MSPAYWTARALNSAFGTELYSGFDRGYDVGGRIPPWALAIGKSKLRLCSLLYKMEFTLWRHLLMIYS